MTSATAGVEALFEREYARLVRALAVAFDPESAADAVQEAFIKADRDWRRVGQHDDPAGWVRRVALNRLLNGRRDRVRREEITATLRPVDRTQLPAAAVELRDAVDRLPRAMRLAVCLHYLAGLSVEEVAGALRVTPGTVKPNLHDARHRLRTTLEDGDD